ncbi:HAD family hydrolase [Nocardioides sp. W7]|uniref:HAD family hydrolase n=1 Tax=Nocardioides sp. W7 TaxID=2931390 RepID=UPI001FD5D135|nr:HAD family hydrolase [Nocardioides sp. W7]
MTGSTAAALAVVLLPALIALLVPLARWSVTRQARQAGIEFRDAAALAAARAIDTVFLDRWGTVTTGQLVVTSVDPIEEGNGRSLRWFAAALEHGIEHPVARAIARLGPPGRLGSVENLPGRGISGSVDRHPVRVGSPGWLGMDERHGLGSTVAVEVDHRPFGYLTVSDNVRTDATTSVERLLALGVEPILLSDDSALNAEHLAQQCGVEEWLVVTEPEKRERLVRERQETGRRVAVVARAEGNAEALAAADLAVSDDPSGTAAVRVDDLDVGRTVQALELGRLVPRLTWRLWCAGGLITAIGVVLVAVGMLSLVLAAGYAVVGSALVVATAVAS